MSIINIKCPKCKIELSLSDDSIDRLKTVDYLHNKDGKLVMKCPAARCDGDIEIPNREN